MSKPSHIPLFPDAYLRDNYRLTLEQHGLYLLLLMEAWDQEDCSLPDDDAALANIAQISVARFRKIATPVLSKWTRSNGRIFQNRLRKEWRYVREKSAKRKAAADHRWASKCNANAMHMECTYGEGGGGGEEYPSQVIKFGSVTREGR